MRDVIDWLVQPALEPDVPVMRPGQLPERRPTAGIRHRGQAEVDPVSMRMTSWPATAAPAAGIGECMAEAVAAWIRMALNK
jgi:hypothetical protein